MRLYTKYGLLSMKAIRKGQSYSEWESNSNGLLRVINEFKETMLLIPFLDKSLAERVLWAFSHAIGLAQAAVEPEPF